MTTITFPGIPARLCAVVVLALVLGPAASQDVAADEELAALREQVSELSKLAVRTQSHIMVDVEYHFTNLWYAAQNQQWELAAFYLRETRSHLAWAVRVRPQRRITAGGSVDLTSFQQIIDQGGFSGIEDAVNDKSLDHFAIAYRQALSECHACHVASGMDYLDPHMPDRPESTLMLHSE